MYPPAEPAGGRPKGTILMILFGPLSAQSSRFDPSSISLCHSVRPIRTSNARWRQNQGATDLDLIHSRITISTSLPESALFELLAAAPVRQDGPPEERSRTCTPLRH